MLTKTCFTAVDMAEHADVHIVYTGMLQIAHTMNRSQLLQRCPLASGAEMVGKMGTNTETTCCRREAEAPSQH